MTLAQDDQDNEEYEKGVNEIFNPPPPTEYPNMDSCLCVPYYKCNNETIISDGTGLIDIRFVFCFINNFI